MQSFWHSCNISEHARLEILFWKRSRLTKNLMVVSVTFVLLLSLPTQFAFLHRNPRFGESDQVGAPRWNQVLFMNTPAVPKRTGVWKGSVPLVQLKCFWAQAAGNEKWKLAWMSSMQEMRSITLAKVSVSLFKILLAQQEFFNSGFSLNWLVCPNLAVCLSAVVARRARYNLAFAACIIFWPCLFCG